MQENTSNVMLGDPGSIALPATSRWREIAGEVIQFHNFVLEHSRRSREDAMLALGMALKTGPPSFRQREGSSWGMDSVAEKISSGDVAFDHQSLYEGGKVISGKGRSTFRIDID